MDCMLICEWCVLVLGISVSATNCIFGFLVLGYSISRAAHTKTIDGNEFWVLCAAVLAFGNCVRVLEHCPIISFSVSSELRLMILQYIGGLVVFTLGTIITFVDLNFIRRRVCKV